MAINRLVPSGGGGPPLRLRRAGCRSTAATTGLAKSPVRAPAPFMWQETSGRVRKLPVPPGPQIAVASSHVGPGWSFGNVFDSTSPFLVSICRWRRFSILSRPGGSELLGSLRGEVWAPTRLNQTRRCPPEEHPGCLQKALGTARFRPRQSKKNDVGKHTGVPLRAAPLFPPPPPPPQNRIGGCRHYVLFFFFLKNSVPSPPPFQSERVE